jgi:hypothetical protein
MKPFDYGADLLELFDWPPLAVIECEPLAGFDWPPFCELEPLQPFDWPSACAVKARP